jgi:hypothetical protein
MTLCTAVPNIQGTNSSDVSIKLWCYKQLYLEEVDTVQDSPDWCCTPCGILPVRAGVKTWCKYCHVLYNNQNLSNDTTLNETELESDLAISL